MSAISYLRINQDDVAIEWSSVGPVDNTVTSGLGNMNRRNRKFRTDKFDACNKQKF